jgi:putative ABC transport system ATP-binding protein
MDSLLELKGLKKNFIVNDLISFEVIKKVDFKLTRAERIVVTGESGGGKTTLLNILSLLDSNFQGDYFIDKVNVNKLRGNKLAKIRNEFFGVVFQDFNLIEEETVYDNLLVPLLYSKKIKRSQRSARIKEITEILKLTPFLELKVMNLSGGQKQRVAIGRAIINFPEVLILDEPTANLNPELATEVMNFIFDHAEANQMSLIMTTHRQQHLEKDDFDKHYILENGVLVLHSH